ncbi:MAG: adenylate/guanylate cyclase domain-containing protein [Alphaproteobacteria bacterium]|nr:adenylate/guanylate cyclase domain-containing protein [Alphaproteobacteria bacterium]
MINRVRLISGLVLFAFVLSHLLNHTLGLISLEVMEDGRRLFNDVWRNLPGTVLLYGSLAVHFFLGIYALYRRRGFRMSGSEAAQLLLGLAAVPLLAEHVLSTRLLEELTDLKGNYAYVIHALWVQVPSKGAIQAAALTVVWTHGVIGLYFWLRLKPAVAALLPVLLIVAILIPVLSLLGFVSAGREVAQLAADPAWLAETKARMNWPQPGDIALISDLKLLVWILVAAAIAIALVARGIRGLWQARRGAVVITYPGPRAVRVRKGLSILEASRAMGIPHASVCGGRGRCSTCRVRVGHGREALPPPSEAERLVLERVNAAPDTRLACQLRPDEAISVVPLLPATAGLAEARARGGMDAGHEQEVAILFADVRDFTDLSDGRLPYDVVFVLNRYFEAMGKAVEDAGGRLDKFMGDGVMALFGIGGDGASGARDAITAARAMALALRSLNESLQEDLPEPIRIGIGIHIGPVILGEMGYGRARQFTAIGNAVNTASRLEALTKDFACQLVVSEDVGRASGYDLSAYRRERATVRGLRESLAVFAIDDAAALPPPEPQRRAAG